MVIGQLQQQVQDQSQQLAERDQSLAQRGEERAQRDALLQRKDRQIALREAKIGYNGINRGPDGVRVRITKPEDVDKAVPDLRKLAQPVEAGGLFFAPLSGVVVRGAGRARAAPGPGG